MMRDDFTLFDEYEYVPPPAHLLKGEFPVPIQTRALPDDQRCKKKHLEMWKSFTTEKVRDRRRPGRRPPARVCRARAWPRGSAARVRRTRGAPHAG